MLAVVQTFSGPEALARGTCQVCGWTGLQTWDVGLVRVDDGYELDDEPICHCPSCGLQEVQVALNVP